MLIILVYSHFLRMIYRQRKIQAYRTFSHRWCTRKRGVDNRKINLHSGMLYRSGIISFLGFNNVNSCFFARTHAVLMNQRKLTVWDRGAA